jgi:quinoprotein glucose dehydrogenase
VALLGADAWSTRYSPLDQNQRVEFQPAAGSVALERVGDGIDEYYRTTPLYANGQLFTVATTRRYATRSIRHRQRRLDWKLDEGIRWQKAPASLATRTRVMTDWSGKRARGIVSPGYHMAILDAKTARAIRPIGAKKATA